MIVKSPIVVTGTLESYDIKINVYGDGLTGQAGAMRNGIDRALLEAGEDFRAILNSEGFLNHDSSVKESTKYSLRGF